MTTLNLVVLALAAYRAWRIVALDDITKSWRGRILGYDDTGHKNRWPANRKTLGNFIKCPFCLGFWIALAAWLCFRAWPHDTLLVAWPLALSALAGLVAKNLDD